MNTDKEEEANQERLRRDNELEEMQNKLRDIMNGTSDAIKNKDNNVAKTKQLENNLQTQLRLKKELETEYKLKKKTLGKYSKRRRSNVAVIIVRVIFISEFLFYCLLLNHSFPTNPNKITNCFKLFSLLQLTTTLLLRRFFLNVRFITKCRSKH